jgi:hypothetical protein
MDPFRDPSTGYDYDAFLHGAPETRALSLTEQIQQTRQHLAQLEQQRSLSEQIQKTEQHLTYLLSLSGSAGRQQPQNTGKSALLRQPSLSKSMVSSWSSGDSNRFLLPQHTQLQRGRDDP